MIDAFYDGFSRIAEAPWTFVAKFDGDLSFDRHYFGQCLAEFHQDPSLGIAGGTCCKLLAANSFRNTPANHDFVSAGRQNLPSRMLRADRILIRAPGWDTVDLIKANMLGWKTRTFSHIRLQHLRPTGGAYGSWNDWVKNGLANYISGYDPIFMACKCLRRTLKSPHANGAGLWLGYLKGYFNRTSRVGDPAMIRYLRVQQRRALTFRKSLWN